LCAKLDERASGNTYAFTRRYQAASITVLLAIVAWVADNLACKALHTLPWGLPYPQTHAIVWHPGMAYVCHCLCLAVVAKDEQRTAHACR